MARSEATKSFTQQSQKRPVLLRYLTFRIILPTLLQPFPAHFLYSRLALLILGIIPSNFRVWIALFISQEIELSAVVLHHLHGHYEPLQYGMGYQPFHIAVTPTLFSGIFTYLWVFSHTWDECSVKCSIIF